MHGDTAVISTALFDLQFFTFANSSFDLVTRVGIDYYPEDLAVDGDTAAITTRTWDETSADKSEPVGVVDVYGRNQTGVWSRTARLRPEGLGRSRDWSSVDIDANILAVGVPSDLQGGGGYVFVYRRNGTAWTEEARLSPPRSDKADGEKADVHYLGVSVSSKGTLIAVSDYQYGDEDEGAVFVYKFDSLTKSWTPVGGPLVNPDCDLHFGSIVSLTQEDALFVTCGWTDGDSGSFYYYEPPGTGEDYVLRQSFALDDAIASFGRRRELPGRGRTLEGPDPRDSFFRTPAQGLGRSRHPRRARLRCILRPTCGHGVEPHPSRVLQERVYGAGLL